MLLTSRRTMRAVPGRGLPRVVYDRRAGWAARARFRGFGRGGGVLGPPDGPPLAELFVGGAPCSSQRHRIICSAVAPFATTRRSTFLAWASLPALARAGA